MVANCKFSRCLAMIASMAAMLLVTGCGKKTCHFVAYEADGLEAGAPVVWYNATIGSVSEVRPDGDGFLVDIAFDSAHAKSVHDGVTAWVVTDSGVSSGPFVELRGGRDEKRPILKNGVRIPAPRPGNKVEKGFMRFDDWLSGKRVEELGLLVALIGFLKLFGKRIGIFFRRLFILAVLAMIAYIAWSVRTDWQGHKERFSLPDLKAISEPVTGWLTNNVDKVKALAPLVEDDED